MPDQNPLVENDFLRQLTATMEEHIADDNFGVSELAGEMGMSRSNLLRKIKKLTRLSASQFIRQVRLKKAMEMLRQTSLNVSEVSYKVGFSSTSYFIKCFREYYGFPPGEVGKRDVDTQQARPAQKPAYKRGIILMLSIAVLIVMALVVLLYLKPPGNPVSDLEKSIVVLPFKNDSNDSTNVYLINGLMESTLNNLQKINDLRVISRTSAEKYRNSDKSIPEMAEELNVSYFVEGSGQKIGDQILLNIQLIEAANDRHLWAKQYERKTTDIYKLQQEIAKSIAEEIHAVITPEEEERINKIPTNNHVAYDFYLKGLNHLSKGGEKLAAAIPEFKRAIKHDPKFALAYADLAITYYYLDIFQKEKKYQEELNASADQALLLDPKLSQALMAKAFFYMNEKEYKEALPYMEKALEYNPNSGMVISALADFYANYMPDTAKYLEYALKGIKVEVAANDSVTTSYIYLHLANALIQNGFVDEALTHIRRSLDFNPENPYANYVKAFMLYAKNDDLQETKNLLIRELKKDTTRVDILQDLGKVCYYMADFEESWKYYKRFVELREAYQLDIYQHENLTIGLVMEQMGDTAKARKYFEGFKKLADENETIYRPLMLAGYYAVVMDEKELAMEQMRLFAREENFFYWIVLFLGKDPMMQDMYQSPECQQLITKINSNFWRKHEKIKVRLEDEGLL